MKKFLLAIFPVILIGSLNVSAQCGGFNDGFESASFGSSWTTGTGVYTYSFPNTSPAMGTYNMNMSCASTNAFYQGPIATFTGFQPTYVSWWARTNTTTGANGYFVLGDVNTPTNNGILFCYFNGTSELRFFNTSGYNYPITANTWYHIEARNINWTSKTMDIYINNALILTAWAFRTPSSTSVDHLYMHSLVAASVDYDDIIIGNPPVTATSSSGSVTCPGGSNGSASVIASGGNGTYTYSWSPSGGTAATESNLSAGTYVCTITDGVGCINTQSVTVTEPAVITGSTAITNVLCNGNFNGAIDLTPSGGAGGYFFNWTNGATTEDISGLAAGTYTLQITDALGCQGSAMNITVTEPAAFSSTTSSTPATCGFGTDGSVSIAVSGGTAGYTYSWNPGGATTASVSSLSAGLYTCMVTDANGCTMQNAAVVSEPTPFFTAFASTDVTCNGLANGSSGIIVTGGTPGYAYSWSNGDITANASNLGPGTYTCTVVDANSCTTSNTVTINEPGVLTGTATVNNASCNGTCNGVSTVNISGGTAPMSFVWSSGNPDSPVATGLCMGTYTCSITDANGCTASTSFAISEPTAISLSAVSANSTSCSSPNGSIDLTASGGTPAYSYEWSTFDLTEDLSGIPGGTYSVVVMDANLCSDTLTVTITQPAAPNVSLSLAQDTICVSDGAMTLSGGSPAGGTWSGTGVTGSTLNPSTGGQGLRVVTYTYTDPNTGCNASATNSVFVSACVGVTEYNSSLTISVYPNPGNGEFVIEYPGFTNPAPVVLINSLGQVVGEWMMNSSRMNVDVRSLPAGIYELQILTANGKLSSRIIKE